MEKWEKKIVFCGLWLSAWAVMIGCVIYFFIYMLVLAGIGDCLFLNIVGMAGLLYGVVKICAMFGGKSDETDGGTGTKTGAKTGARKSTKTGAKTGARKSTKTAPKK